MINRNLDTMKIHVQFVSLCCILLVCLTAHSHCKQTKYPKEIPHKLLRKSILGPSWEFQGVDHKWTWKQKHSDAESEVLSVFVRKFERSHEFAKSQLLSMFGKESTIESRLKPIKSIAEDLDDDGNRTVKDIYDVVSWRVTFPTVQQVR